MQHGIFYNRTQFLIAQESVFDTLNSPDPSFMRGRGFPLSFFIVKFYYEYITIHLYRLL